MEAARVRVCPIFSFVKKLLSGPEILFFGMIAGRIQQAFACKPRKQSDNNPILNRKEWGK